MAKICVTGQSLPSGDYQPNWTTLINFLENLGHEITFDSKGEVLLALDHNPKGLKQFLLTSQSGAKRILIRQETDSVYPLQYSKSIVHKYDLVITLGIINNDDTNSEFFGHCYKPYPNPLYPTAGSDFLEILQSREKENRFSVSNWNSRPLLFTFIGGNKVGLGKSKNYSFRTAKIKEYLDHGLIVYGSFWNSGILDRVENRIRTLVWGLRTKQFENIIGIFKNIFARFPKAYGNLEDKSEILLNSKFSLVIENSNNFVTD